MRCPFVDMRLFLVGAVVVEYLQDIDIDYCWVVRECTRGIFFHSTQGRYLKAVGETGDTLKISYYEYDSAQSWPWSIKTRYVGFHWRKYYLSILRHRSNHPVTNTSHQNPSLFTGSNVNHFPICHQGVEQFTKQCLSMSLLMCATQFSLLSDRSFQGLVPTLSSKDCHSALFSD